MKITYETQIPDEDVEEFLVIYRESFAPLELLSPLRQSMTDEEFRAEMRHETVLKLVVWSDDGRPAAILCMTTDATMIPWLNPGYYANRFPEQFEEKRIFFFGSLLVHPDRRGQHFLIDLLTAAIRVVASNVGIAAFDCCRYNVEETRLPEIIASVGETLCNFEPIELDYQKFYAYVSSGLK